MTNFRIVSIAAGRPDQFGVSTGSGRDRSADILSDSVRSTLSPKAITVRSAVRAARSGGQDVRAPIPTDRP
jgi:hypothetical protein